ncbi:hypothetical protein EI94DRAFT_1724080 [Lactarius quietus]|nr:hypothetical protein EI94DRAFT_1724080 [Lactarius quietus]
MPGSAIVDLSTSYGAAFIGFIVSVALFGLTLGQTWMYFWHYWNSNDTKALKSFIVFITVMDTAHTAIFAYGLHWYLVQNFGNLDALAANTWSWTLRAISVESTPLPCNSIMQDKFTSSAETSFLRSLSFATTHISDRYHSLIWLVRLAMGQCVVADVLIAVAMCWALYRKKTGLASTDSMIMTLMTYTIHSGLLTSLLGAAMMISFIVLPESLIPMAIVFSMGKCYVNSVLAMLNSRDYVRGRSNLDDSNNSFKMISSLVAPPSDALEFERFEGLKSRQTDGSVMHCSTASNYARRERI